jgi:hypothetical protein
MSFYKKESAQETLSASLSVNRLCARDVEIKAQRHN